MPPKTAVHWSAGRISCFRSSRGSSRATRSRRCWRPRWPRFTWRRSPARGRWRAPTPRRTALSARSTGCRGLIAQMDALARYRAGDEHDVSRPELPAGEGGEAILGDGTQAPPVEASDAAVPRAEGRRTAVARVAAPRTAAQRTQVARATVPRTTASRTQVSRPQISPTQVPRVTEPACRATAPPARGEATSPSQPEIAPAFARRARADVARSPA